MKSLLLTAALTLATSAGFAATHTIKMLNNGKEGIMVFEPAYLKANKGDTIKFVPTDAAHDVASVSMSLRKTKRPFPDSSLAARARRALLNEGFPGKPYVA